MASIFTVGSINVDLVAFCDKSPAQGETVLGTAFEQHPGGKGANQAVAVARAGASSIMVGALGDDLYGQNLREILVLGYENHTTHSGRRLS